MSTLGKDWASERYQEYQRAGLSPSQSHVPVPAPHWPNDVQLLPSQMDDDWSICLRQNPEAYVLVEEGADKLVFDLEEVR